MKLITIKEYCKIEGITDAGARKRVSSKLVKSVILDEILYIVISMDKERNEIKSLKNKLKHANDRTRILQAEKQVIQNQKELVEKLEDKIEKLEGKLEAIQVTKDALYEKVIGHFTMHALPNKD